jgi:hypothetical protein
MTKILNLKLDGQLFYLIVANLKRFENLKFGFRICFGFRNSIFEFNLETVNMEFLTLA